MTTLASAHTLVGTVLSQRWRLTRKLGEGSLGGVYAAEAVGGGGPHVAIKLLRPELVADPRVRARFTEETPSHVRLVHPNVVRVLERAIAEDGTAYVVTELCDGVPLGAYTQNGGRVPIAQAVPILQGILAGLAAGHAQGIVHRDLKPENVFLTRQANGAFVVQVIDFGLAEITDALGGPAQANFAGTVAYMSPEQIKRASDVDLRTDVWSAGVLLYEMLTGRVAFPAPTEYARIAVVLGGEPEPMDRTDRALAQLQPCVSRALRKNRDERFASATEMSRALATLFPSASTPPPDPRVAAAPGAPPLSRLPDVPSLFAPPQAFAPHFPSTIAHTAPVEAREPRPGRQKPGGTLASAPGPDALAEPAAPIVVVGQGLDGTLPSKDVPMLAGPAVRAALRRSRLWMLGSSAVALAIGFALGWLCARWVGR